MISCENLLVHSFVLQEKNSINNFLELKRKNHIFQHHVLPWNVEWTICRKEIKLCLPVWLPKKIFCTFYLESRLNEGSVLESILVCFSLSHSNLRSNQNMILILIDNSFYRRKYSLQFLAFIQQYTAYHAMYQNIVFILQWDELIEINWLSSFAPGHGVLAPGTGK